MTAHPLSHPVTFTKEFFLLANTTAPPHGNASRATAWFETRMLELAEKHGVDCQNRQGTVRAEWMNIDHVFIQKNHRYDNYPLVAVEHENGDLCDDSKRGELPSGYARGAYTEWAAWKALTMAAQLHVLVAYPWRVDKAACLSILAQMVSGYQKTYGIRPNALFLLGWWDADTAWTSAEQLYVPYIPVWDDDHATPSLKEFSLD